MPLDPTARESNFRDSIKKYFVDNLHTIEGIDLSFDKTLSTPYLQKMTQQKWIMVNWGLFSRGAPSTASIDVTCCTRKDNEGFQLAQLSDKVVGYLTDENTTDGMKRIPFYRSYADKAWELLGSLLVWDISESISRDAPDMTKFKILTVQFKFISKI